MKSRQKNARGTGRQLREEIVEAALRVIDTGPQRLTLTAVAREAGIAGPSIYDHFPGVEEIRFEVIRSCYDALIGRVLTAAAGCEDPRDRLHAICAFCVGYADEFPKRYALVFGGERDEVEWSAVRGRGRAALQTLVDAIAECATAGASASQDSDGDAVALWAAIHGLAMLRGSRPADAALHREQTLRDLVDRIALLTR